MVTLGFFDVGGRRWSASTEHAQLLPNKEVFEVESPNQEGCRECLVQEMRCAALLGEDAREQCRVLAESLVSARQTACEVRSYVSAGVLPEPCLLAPVLATCDSICHAPSRPPRRDFSRGYDRPYLSSFQAP